jgi:hypothetical protein
LSIALAAAFLVAACAQAATPEPTATQAPPTTPAPKDIVDIAVEDGCFETLVAAL